MTCEQKRRLAYGLTYRRGIRTFMKLMFSIKLHFPLGSRKGHKRSRRVIISRGGSGAFQDTYFCQRFQDMPFWNAHESCGAIILGRGPIICTSIYIKR